MQLWCVNYLPKAPWRKPVANECRQSTLFWFRRTHIHTRKEKPHARYCQIHILTPSSIMWTYCHVWLANCWESTTTKISRLGSLYPIFERGIPPDLSINYMWPLWEAHPPGRHALAVCGPWMTGECNYYAAAWDHSCCSHYAWVCGLRSLAQAR